MTSNVLQFPKFKPYLSGEVQCFGCKEEWVASAPVGTVDFECPSCGSMKGRVKYECSYNDVPHFQCHCGCEYFCITPDFIYCPNCGVKPEV